MKNYNKIRKYKILMMNLKININYYLLIYKIVNLMRILVKNIN